jgi:alkylation response protein AidB-like acyl-CoA dehydrogenase
MPIHLPEAPMSRWTSCSTTGCEAEGLNRRPRFADHSRETFDAVLDTCERIAREKYAPFNRLVDTQEPRFDGEKVILPQAPTTRTRPMWNPACSAPRRTTTIGGMQLPYTVEAAANAFFALASVSIGSSLLTKGNANLLLVHGTELQKPVFAPTSSTAASPAPCA